MKLITLIILAFLSTSYAADRLDTLRDDVANSERTLDDLENQLKTYQDAYAKLKKQDGCVGPFCRIRKEDTNVRAAMQVLLEGGTVDGVRYPGIDRVKKDIAEYRLSLRKQKEELKAEERRIENERKEFEREQRKFEREDKRRQDQLARDEEQERKLHDRELESFRRRLKTMDVESDLNKLEYRTLGDEQKILEIQRAYDNSLLGAYLEEKMKLLLSSDVMCESIKSCSNGINTKANASSLEKDLREDVFPNNTTSSTQQSGSSGKR